MRPIQRIALYWPRPSARAERPPRSAQRYFFLLSCLTRLVLTGRELDTPATPAGTKVTKAFTLPLPFLFTCFFSFFAVFPFGLTGSLNDDAPVRVSPISLTFAVAATSSVPVLVIETWPGPGTLALMIAVPFFFLRVIELIVILFEGAAASRKGDATPEIRLGLGLDPLMLARPIRLDPSEWPSSPQKTYWGLTATPEGPT